MRPAAGLRAPRRPRRPALALGLVALGCAATLPQVPRGPAPPDDHRPEGLQVDEPPPPALIEQTVVAHPDSGCVWMDGHHTWGTSRRWDWVPGGWVRPPPGCFRADPTWAWSGAGPDARLLYWPPRWYPDDILERPPGPPPGCPEPQPCPPP